MADRLILRGYKHIEGHSGSEITMLRPPGSLGHFNVPRWWKRSGSVVYVPAVKFNIAGYGDVTVVGNRSLYLEVEFDQGQLIFNRRKQMHGVERIKVSAAGDTTNYDDYSVNGIGELVKKQVGSGFTPPAAPAPITVTVSNLTPNLVDEEAIITFGGGPAAAQQTVRWSFDNDGGGADVQNPVTVPAGTQASAVPALLLRQLTDPNVQGRVAGSTLVLTPTPGDFFRAVSASIT